MKILVIANVIRLNTGIHGKGSGDVVSAVCYAIYTIYLFLRTQTADISRNLFVNSPVHNNIKHVEACYTLVL